MLPHYDTKDGWTWLETVRELGEDFFAGDRKGAVVLEIPITTESGSAAPPFATGRAAC